VFILFYIDNYLIVFIKEYCKAIKVIIQELYTQYKAYKKGEISSFINI